MRKAESQSHPLANESVGIALARLRGGVTLCCLAIMWALLVHIVIWSLVVFTDIRFEAPPNLNETINIVIRDKVEAVSPLAADSLAGLIGDTLAAPDSKQDGSMSRMFALSVALAGGFGKLAALCLLGLIAVGVLLAAGSATTGVEKTVGAFTWSMVVGLLVLPVGNAVGLPWGAGALASFGEMVDSGDSLGFTVVARFLVLPGTCILGLGLVMWRFRAGVKAAMLPPAYHLDSRLERETANLKADSLHNGRGGHALKRVMEDETISSPPQFGGRMPRAKEVSPGVAPRRLI